MSSPKNDIQATARSIHEQSEANESSPLLPTSPAERSVEASLPRHRIFRTRQSIILVLLLVILLCSFGDQLEEAPLARIYESIICYKYYEQHDTSKLRLPRNELGAGAIGGVDEMWCKEPEVQDDLAMLNGLQPFLDGLPGLLLAVPFGWAADRYGRWPFLMLNIIQAIVKLAWAQFVAWQWQIFDVRALWARSLFCILGGGDQVASALFFVSVSDVVSEKERASVFLRVGATNISASLFMPPLAALLMRRSPWIPSLMGTAMFLLAILLYSFVPETLNYTTPEDHLTPNIIPVQGPETITADPLVPANFVVRSAIKLKKTMTFLTRDYRVTLLILPFITHMLAASSTQLLLQYISKRYNLTFSSATLLVTVRNGVQVLLLFTILPCVSTLAMKRFRLSSQTKDLYLARASQVLAAVGWVAVAASPNIPVVAISLAVVSMGQGAMLLVRSFLSSIVPADEIARTYSVIAIVDTVGVMLGSPLLAILFEKGMVKGPAWTGLPFLFLGSSAALFAGLLFVIRLRKGEDEVVQEDARV